MSAGNLDTAGLQWAQRRRRPPDAGRDIQALLRWNYSHGWVDLQGLRDDHRRLQVFSREQLEFAALNSRHRGDYRFQVSRREGRTVIALRGHLLQPRRTRAPGGAANTGASGSQHVTGGNDGDFSLSRSDTEATEAPAGGTEFDGDDSTAAWESVTSAPYRADRMSPTGSIGPNTYLRQDGAGDHP